MNNLRNIVIKSGYCRKPFMFLKYSGLGDEDKWEKIGASYTIKGAYDLVKNNPLGFEFLCNKEVEIKFKEERDKRKYASILHAKKNREII